MQVTDNTAIDISRKSALAVQISALNTATAIDLKLSLDNGTTYTTFYTFTAAGCRVLEVMPKCKIKFVGDASDYTAFFVSDDI